MEILDSFLELLMDGEWHDLTVIASRLGITEMMAGIIAGFFQHYGFIERDGVNAKLDEKVREFLRSFKWVERVECRKADR